MVAFDSYIFKVSSVIRTWPPSTRSVLIFFFKAPMPISTPPCVSIPGRGRRTIFSKFAGNKLLKLISKSPSDFGFETDFWTTSRIQVSCKEQLKLKASRMAIHRILVKFEQSYRKPQNFEIHFYMGQTHYNKVLED